MASLQQVGMRLREVFGVDLRALAVLRIGLGASALLTLASYGGDYADLVGAEGVLSLDTATTLAIAGTALLLEPFRLAPGLFEWLLFAALLALGLALTLGFRTRLACLGCWLGLLCLRARNPVIGDYGDDLLVCLLLWGVALPLGARFSLDARRAGPAARASNPHVSIASIALLVQVAWVYFSAGLLKTGSDWTEEASAVQYLMEQSFRATPLTAYLRDFPGLMAIATRVTPPFEMAIALALFVPIAPALVRTLTVALIIGFHVMLAAFITLGAAWIISISAALALLPPAFWDRLTALLGGGSAPPPSPSAEAPAGGGTSRLAAAGQLLIAVPALVMLLDVVAVSSGESRVVPAPARWLAETLRLGQRWEMFAPSVAHFDGWFTAPGILASGRVVDVVRGGASLRTEPPETVPWLGDDYRMGIFRDSVRNRLPVLGNDFGRWLCRSWNRSHTDDERLLRVEFVWMHIDFPRAGARKQPERIWQIRRRCEPPAA